MLPGHKRRKKLSPLLQQGAPRGSLASAGEGRGEASRCASSIVEVSTSQFVSCSDRKAGPFGPSRTPKPNIRMVIACHVTLTCSNVHRQRVNRGQSSGNRWGVPVCHEGSVSVERSPYLGSAPDSSPCARIMATSTSSIKSSIPMKSRDARRAGNPSFSMTSSSAFTTG